MMAQVYEYKIVENLEAASFEAELEALDADGWEVIGFDWNEGASSYSALLRRRT